ncbi:MAG: ankyrin repeat domain-containing protein [Fimbriimonadaceae bacterium]|nr:ankyrin repeat domain-containing protein [Fimbriimonadaceae bacterium]
MAFRPAMLAPVVAMAAVLTGLLVWTRSREDSSPTGLVSAIVAGDDERAARIVASGVNPDTLAQEVPRGRARASVIVLAVERRLVRTVVALVRAKADVAHSVPEPPLHAAARLDLDDMCALLAGRGAPLDALNANGRTALQVAAEAGSVRALRMLLRLDHDRTPTRGTGESLLHLAARSGSPEALRAVLAEGATVEARNARGETPLMVAARAGQAAALRVLIKAGADVNKTSGGESVLMRAMERNPEAALVLIEAGARVDGEGVDGWTPLHRAVAHPEVARALLAKGANPNARNAAGQTPLHLAAEAGQVESVRLLLGAGADASAKDLNGETPLRYLDRAFSSDKGSRPARDEGEIRRLLAQAAK